MKTIKEIQEETMKEYQVTITKTITLKANSQEEAEEMVKTKDKSYYEKLITKEEC